MYQPLEAGQILNGKYKIVRLIGEGGMARVWLAEEMTFGNRRVAIKEPKTESDADQHADARRRFTQELKINAALSVHAPSVVPTYTVEQWGDRPLLVMAYMAGGDLAKRIHDAGEGLPVESAIAVTRSLLTALQAAHSHAWEIVHRDIKPANVLFDEAGNGYLADFGLAQLSGSSSNRTKLMGGAQPGTPNYMAPEQVSSPAPLTPAADINALGCVLFEMLTGKRYKRMKPGTRVAELRRDVPAWLDALVARAVAENPWERFEDGAAMLVALNAGGSRSAVSMPNLWKAAVGILLVLALITWGAWRWINPPIGEVTPTAIPIAANPTILVTPTPSPDLDATAAAGTILAQAETSTATPSDAATPTPSETATPAPTPDLEATIAAGMAATNTAVALANPSTPTVIRVNPPPSTATPTPLAAPLFVTVSLQSQSELLIPETNLGLQPGRQDLLGYPFDVGWKATTQCSHLPDRPEDITLHMNVKQPEAVYLLLQAGWGWQEYAEKEIGRVSLLFANGYKYDTPLVLGINVRDWSVDEPGAVTTIVSPSIQEAWRGTAAGRTGRIDLLKISIPEELRTWDLTHIELVDTSLTNVSNINPCIHLLAVTVQSK